MNTMENHMLYIETGKDFKDYAIKEFQMKNEKLKGNWIGQVKDNVLYCKNADNKMSFQFPCKDTTKINMTIIPLDRCKKQDYAANEYEEMEY